MRRCLATALLLSIVTLSACQTAVEWRLNSSTVPTPSDIMAVNKCLIKCSELTFAYCLVYTFQGQCECNKCDLQGIRFYNMEHIWLIGSVLSSLFFVPFDSSFSNEGTMGFGEPYTPYDPRAGVASGPTVLNGKTFMRIDAAPYYTHLEYAVPQTFLNTISSHGMIVAFWLKTYNNNGQTLLQGISSSGYRTMDIQIVGGSVYYSLTAASGYLDSTITGITPYQWHHLAFVINNQAGTAQSWLNGQSQNVVTGIDLSNEVMTKLRFFEGVYQSSTNYLHSDVGCFMITTESDKRSTMAAYIRYAMEFACCC